MLIVAAVGVVDVAVGQRDASFDHQAVTYVAAGKATFVDDVDGSISPFFSPDTSIETFVRLIDTATTSIDVATPGFSSWSNCTQFNFPLIGCGVGFVRGHEAFPVFRALLNALSRGVRVRILTNDYGVFCAPGRIDPLDFLHVAGATVRFYRTTTFLHTKYVAVDGKRVIVSSVNYSQTSFMRNREAGVVLEGPGFKPIFGALTSYFDADWAAGGDWVSNVYNASDMAILLDRRVVAVPLPPPPHIAGTYRTHSVTVNGPIGRVGIIANPDDAWSIVGADLRATQHHLAVYMYQVMTPFCETLLALHRRGVDVELLVSDRIFDEADFEKAQECYTSLHKAGVRIRKTASDGFEYCHQKFWIIDDAAVWLSSGNWGETDFPSGSNVFVPFGIDDGWRNTNRDHTIKMVDKRIVAVFDKVLREDYERGYDWSPPSTL